MKMDDLSNANSMKLSQIFNSNLIRAGGAIDNSFVFEIIDTQ